jgi:Tfp pilus assembly protein PilZ
MLPTPYVSISYNDAIFQATRPVLAVFDIAMPDVELRRACRHTVSWPARVRSVAESTWHSGQVINLSVTGVLLQTERSYEIGERVEVEIDFLTKPESKTVVSGVGHVVREHRGETAGAAIHFDLGCAPKTDLSS